MSPDSQSAGLSAGRRFRLLCALALAGVAIRLSLLAMPPVIPLIHEELRMSETQVGLLIGLPLLLFALASIPGSLLIARAGPMLATVVGMIVATLAGAARGAASDVITLYAAVVVMGFGIAIIQPALPTLVREWVPHRIALGTVVYSGGMLVGATVSSALTIPLVLPLVGGSWRLNLVVWAAVAAAIIAGFVALSPREGSAGAARSDGTVRWWPDWKNPAIWYLGLAFGGNNAAYHATNAFLGEYLTSVGHPEMLSAAFAGLNGSQIVSLGVLVLMSDRIQARLWPFLVFGPLLVIAFLAFMIMPTPFWMVTGAALIGITCAITMTAILALPPYLSAPGDVARTAAGMFTISYSCAIIMPILSGALWDATGSPWTCFLPCSAGAIMLTVFGAAAARGKRGDRMAAHL
jgi:CP family cyanate transporter-like MFS transporter